MADDDTLTTASTYWRDAAVLAETFQQKKSASAQASDAGFDGHAKTERTRRRLDRTSGKDHEVDLPERNAA